MSQKEIARYGVIENTVEGFLKADLAAEELCLSKRQVFGLERRPKEKRIRGIMRGNRGRASLRGAKKHHLSF